MRLDSVLAWPWAFDWLRHLRAVLVAGGYGLPEYNGDDEWLTRDWWWGAAKNALTIRSVDE